VFALSTLAIVNFALGPMGGRADVMAAFLWTVLLFSASAGLAQAFVREVERKTWLTLRLVASPSAILLGQVRVNLALLVATELLSCRSSSRCSGEGRGAARVFSRCSRWRRSGSAAAVTLVSALIAQARAHGALVSALVFPLVVPGMMAAVVGTREALTSPFRSGDGVAGVARLRRADAGAGNVAGRSRAGGLRMRRSGSGWLFPLNVFAADGGPWVFFWAPWRRSSRADAYHLLQHPGGVGTVVASGGVRLALLPLPCVGMTWRAMRALPGCGHARLPVLCAPTGLGGDLLQGHVGRVLNWDPRQTSSLPAS